MIRRTTDRRGNYAHLGGVMLHWYELGEGDGPPLVLLHGLGDSHRTWLEVAPALARRRRVYVPDLAGHGRSGRPNASYSLEWHARLIGKWLTALGLEDVDLVGHSYGGGVAQWLLLEHGWRVRALGLVASGGLGREVNAALRLAAIPHVVELLGQPFMAPGTILAATAAGRPYSLRELAHLSRMNGRWGTARAFARSVRDVIDLRGQRRGYFQHAHQIERHPRIGLFWGEKDPIIPVTHAEQAAPRMGDGAALTTFRGLGHYPHREDPKAFAAALESFLNAPAPSLAPEIASAAS